MLDNAEQMWSLIASGQMEKAIGGAIGRRLTRQATGGIRGFVRNARFDANAQDADGDGFVQEGTQFARQVARRSASSSTGMRSSISRRPIPERFTPKDLDKYVDTDALTIAKGVAAVNKKVEDALNDGKQFANRKEVEDAFIKAVPSFGTGDSTADFLDGDADGQLTPYEMDIAYLFLHHAITNPYWSSVNWQLKSRMNRLNDMDRTQWDQEGAKPGEWQKLSNERGPGAWAMRRPGSSVEISKGKFRVSKSRKGLIEISYRTDKDTQYADATTRLPKLQTYSTRIFASIMNELNKGDVKTPDERQQIFEDALISAHRSIVAHELTHAAHYIAEAREGSKRIAEELGLDAADPDVVAQAGTRAIVKQMTRRQREEYTKYKVFQALQETWNSLLDGAMMEVQNPNRFKGTPMIGKDGQPHKLTRNQATYISSMLTSMGGSPVSEGDDFSLYHAMLLFGEMKQTINTPNGPVLGSYSVVAGEFRDQSRATFQGQELLRQGKKIMSHPVLGQQVIDVIGHSESFLSILSDKGLPPLRSLNVRALNRDETNGLIDTLMWHAARSEAKNRTSNSFFAALNPSGQERPQIKALKDYLSYTEQERSIDISNMPDRDVYSIATKLVEGEIEELVTSLANSNAPKDKQGKTLGGVFESIIASLGHWDELTEDEIDSIRELARLSGGGKYASYMGYLTEIRSAWQRAFKANSAEFFAELGTLAQFGNVLAIADDAQNPIPITASQRAALRKLFAWLNPGMAFNIGGK